MTLARTFCADQFLLGDDVCVAPVLAPEARGRDLWVPPGVWRDYWTNARYEGPLGLPNYPASLDRVPLFIRE
jgi:alpha-glucosidase (family GH31 glycosyl hydrolase)